MVQRYRSTFRRLPHLQRTRPPRGCIADICCLKVKFMLAVYIFISFLHMMCSADMDSGSIPDSFRPQLHLSRLRYTDRGQYFCVARNSLGTDRSSPFLLNVTCESVSCFHCSLRLCPTSSTCTPRRRHSRLTTGVN